MEAIDRVRDVERDLDFADGVGGEGRREGAAAGTEEFYVVVGVRGEGRE